MEKSRFFPRTLPLHDHFPKDVILTCVRWYVAYPLSTRHVEELMEERGVNVDHATINR